MRNDDTHEFGKAVRRAREHKGLSLSEAARQIGMSKSSLSRLETGDSVISAKRFVQFAVFYEVSAEELLQGQIVAEPRQADFPRIAMVVEEIERTISGLKIRPDPQKVSRAVVEVLRLETARVIDSRDSSFDPSRYRGLVEEIFRK